jgi:ABC-2 type transport system ATP-binding protein
VRTDMTGTAEGAARVAVPARSAAPAAVVVAGLRKSYGAVQAVRGVSFTVRHGEIFALLGPNGAGKTTTLEIMEGFRTADAGRVEVLGYDPGDRACGRALRERIGLVLQDIAVEPYLTVRETIARKKVRNLSGGQKRRLDLALGLIGRPELLFLDEPTTHYMDEAQALADRVAVMAGGQIVAEGTPSDIGGRDTARSRIRIALPDGYTTADLPVAGVLGEGQVSVETAEPTQALHQLTGWALQRGMVLGRLTVDRPSLEDIYLRLTGDDTRIEGSIR